MKLHFTLAFCILLGLVAVGVSGAIANRLGTADTTLITTHAGQPATISKVIDNRTAQTQQVHSIQFALESGRVAPDSGEVYRGWQGLIKLHDADQAIDGGVTCSLR
jgi:hypothetical protein